MRWCYRAGRGWGECPKMPGLGGLGLAFHGLSFQVYFVIYNFESVFAYFDFACVCS